MNTPHCPTDHVWASRRWTRAGGPDANHDDDERERNLRLLTDPNLQTLSRRTCPDARSFD